MIQVSICKLSMNLLNSNNHKSCFYGFSAKCPCCQAHEEILTHVFNCVHCEVESHWIKHKSQLKETITSIGMPIQIIQAVVEGIASWEESQYDKQVKIQSQPIDQSNH